MGLHWSRFRVFLWKLYVCTCGNNFCVLNLIIWFICNSRIWWGDNQNTRSFHLLENVSNSLNKFSSILHAHTQNFQKENRRHASSKQTAHLRRSWPIFTLTLIRSHNKIKSKLEIKSQKISTNLYFNKKKYIFKFKQAAQHIASADKPVLSVTSPLYLMYLLTQRIDCDLCVVDRFYM